MSRNVTSFLAAIVFDQQLIADIIQATPQHDAAGGAKNQ